MFEHQDVLANLDKKGNLSDKLRYIHDTLKQRFPFINRIAVATYETDADLLKTFISSDDSGETLVHYQAKLSDAPSLQEILAVGKPRIVNDLTIFSHSPQRHAQAISSGGFHSSYTMPIYLDEQFFGFIFFNSYENDVFSQESLYFIDLFGHMISLLISHELATIRTMYSTLQAAKHISTFRDNETGAHMDRMSHYSRLIAQSLADKYQLSDEYIEHIFLFSPMHDIGKIGIPDAILKKPGKLTPQEYTVMKSHAAKGREIIDMITKDAHLEAFPHLDILRNIAQYHHEDIDGHGYPQGLHNQEIPIEARIIAVADVFDALTSKRPYKESWTNQAAFDMLQKLTGHKLDKECVMALINNVSEVEAIQKKYSENEFG